MSRRADGRVLYGWTGRLPHPEETVAEFATQLLAEWDGVPARERDVWLRRRLLDLLDRRPGVRGRWIG